MDRPARLEDALATTTHPIREELDVVYGHAGGEDLQLDLFVPKDSAGPFPAVVVLHGGGWAVGSRQVVRSIASSLAGHGYVTASASYRLAPRHRFPAQIEDAKCAVRWLRANAERYHIESERIGAVGFSAGAHLVLLLGLTEAKDGLEGTGGNPEQSSSVQAVVNISGPTDLMHPEWPDATRLIVADFLGGSRDQLPGTYRAASPVSYIHRGAPPVLTIHGTADPVVPYEQAQLLHAALRKARVPSRLTLLHGKGHGENWTGKDQQRNAAAMLAFLDANLRRFAARALPLCPAAAMRYNPVVALRFTLRSREWHEDCLLSASGPASSSQTAGRHR